MAYAQTGRKIRKAGLLYGGAALAAFATSVQETRAQSTDIIVTARKTEERLQDVPVAVTAFTGETFENAGLTQFADIARLTPNFNIRPSGATGDLFAGLTIRGQTAGFITLNADQAVGININGAPITRGTSLFTHLFDVERIEVLKGPQGTLFGKNTTGGVVNVVTKGPDLDRFGGYAKFTYGSFERTEAELVANLPLVEDKIGVRVGTALTHRDGFGRGGAGLALTGRELADDDEIFVRGSILFRPGEAVSVRVNADYHTVDESTSIFRSLRSALGGFIALKSINPDIYVGNDFRADRPFVRSNEFNLNGTIEVDLGAATLSSITSYRTQDSLTLVQSAPSTAVLLGQQSDLYAQELRLAGIAVDGRLKWQVGAFYSDESGVDIDVLKGFSLDTTTAASNKGWSVFTQDSFALTDTLTLTGGVRYTHEKRRVRSLVFTQANKASFDGVSWLVGLDFKPNSDTLLYANVSRGFRSGAIDQDNIATIVQPEFVLNYEVGLKAELFDRRVRFNSAAFYSDYTDIQRTSFDPNSPVPVTVLRNAAQATIWGFEGELNAVPVAGLTLGATVGYTNAKFDKFLDDNGQGVVIDRSDDPIGGPRWQLSASGRYEFDISSVAKAGLQANYFWIGKAILAGPSVAAVLAPGEAILNSYGLLNAQIDLDIADLGGNLGGLNIALFGTNILDKEYYAGGIALALFGGVSNRIVGEPRQWGIRITKEF